MESEKINEQSAKKQVLPMKWHRFLYSCGLILAFVSIIFSGVVIYVFEKGPLSMMAQQEWYKGDFLQQAIRNEWILLFSLLIEAVFLICLCIGLKKKKKKAVWALLIWQGLLIVRNIIYIVYSINHHIYGLSLSYLQELEWRIDHNLLVETASFALDCKDVFFGMCVGLSLLTILPHWKYYQKRVHLFS